MKPLRTSRSTPTCCLMSARSSGTTSSFYGEIKIDPAKLKLRKPWRVFLHESGRYPTLQQWGGGDAAFTRMVELKRQLSPEEEVPKEAATATVTPPIDSHSLWHSIRLTGMDFEGLN